MVTKCSVAALVALAVLLPAASDAMAGKRVKRERDQVVERDCTPYNGPFGYYGNPWCDGGFKYAEDFPPGSGRYFDVLEQPRVQRWWWE